MSRWLKGYSSKVLNQIEKIKERRADKKAANREKKYKRIIQDKTDKKAVEEYERSSQSRESVGSDSDSEENRTLLLKLREFGASRKLPEWAQRQLEQQVLAEKAQRKYTSELDRQKDEVLSRHKSCHWILTGKKRSEPQEREDNLISTPYPFARPEIHVPGKVTHSTTQSQPKLLLKRLKTDDDSTLTTSEISDTKALEKSSTEPVVDETTEKATIAEGKQSQAVQQGSSSSARKVEKPAKPAEIKQKTAPEPKRISPPKGQLVLSSDMKDLEHKGGMDQLINLLFEDEDAFGHIKQVRKDSIDEFETQAEQNAVINLAVAMPGPEDRAAGKGLSIYKKPSRSSGKRSRDKTPKILISFEEIAKFKDYWYASGKHDSDVYTVRLKP